MVISVGSIVDCKEKLKCLRDFRIIAHRKCHLQKLSSVQLDRKKARGMQTDLGFWS